MDTNRTISGTSFARTTIDHRGRRDFATNQTHCTSVDVNPMHTELSVGESVAMGGVFKGNGGDTQYVEQNSITSDLSIGSHRFTHRHTPSECRVVFTDEKSGIAGTGKKTLLRHAVEEDDEAAYIRASYEQAPKGSAL